MILFNKNNFKSFDFILVAILFGSQARGNPDIGSDLDLLLIINDMPFDRVINAEKRFRQYNKNPMLNLCLQTEKTFIKMKAKGSLFAKHLKCEGKIIYQRDKKNDIFVNIANFTEHLKNIELYLSLLTDCRLSLRQYGSNIYDLALLFTICRNTCMVLCHKIGKPHFGRYDVYNCIKNEYPNRFPLSKQNYYTLSQFKMIYSRGIYLEIDIPSINESNKFISSVQKLVEFGMELCSDG